MKSEKSISVRLYYYSTFFLLQTNITMENVPSKIFRVYHPNKNDVNFWELLNVLIVYCYDKKTTLSYFASLFLFYKLHKRRDPKIINVHVSCTVRSNIYSFHNSSSSISISSSGSRENK